MKLDTEYAGKNMNLGLHQPQLFAQVTVDLEELLDLGLRRREGALHLHELLHRDGPVGEVGRLGALRQKSAR